MKNQEQLRQEAEKILNENLIGVNKEAVKKHHHFKKSIIDAMISFASTLSQQQPVVTDEEIEEIANKAYPKALVESPHYKSEREGFIKGLRSRLQETKTTN